MPGSYVNISGRKSSQGCIQPQLSFLQNWGNWALLMYILRILLWPNTPPTVHRKCIKSPLEQNRGFSWFKTSWTSNLQKPLDTLKDGDNTNSIKWIENWAPNANSGATKDDFKTRMGSAKWGQKELGHLGQEGTVWALHNHTSNLCPLSCPPVYLIFTVGCVLLCILQPLPPPPPPGSCSVHRSAGITPVWDSFPWSQLSYLCPLVTALSSF